MGAAATTVVADDQALVNLRRKVDYSVAFLTIDESTAQRGSR
jgi:hypothetical protein